MRPSLADVATLDDVPVDDVELAIVLGGDGTILRAAELVRDGTAPVLGINMGHVGFLAEIERDDMDDAVRRVIARDYDVEERLALQVRVKDAADSVVYETWALNEATVEKASRERMLEVVIEIDGRPLSTLRVRRGRRLDADRVDRVQLLRRRPGDLADGRGDRGRAAVGARAVREAARRRVPSTPSRSSCSSAPNGAGILWCDGRRSHDLPPGARVVVRRSERPVRLARLHPAAFTDRLVRKFRLPVDGLARPPPRRSRPTGASLRDRDRRDAPARSRRHRGGDPADRAAASPRSRARPAPARRWS